ncbi:hypothetical protein [Microvirga tunisiensis]|nr:hypothetical protein [Microvirga tunisiensis]
MELTLEEQQALHLARARARKPAAGLDAVHLGHRRWAGYRGA